MFRSHIYVVKNEGAGFIKVGRTNNPRRRLNSIQTSNPYHIEPLEVIPVDNAIELEMFLHLQLSRYRVRLEWFDLPQERLDELIDELRKLRVGCECSYCSDAHVKREPLAQALANFKLFKRSSADEHAQVYAIATQVRHIPVRVAATGQTVVAIRRLKRPTSDLDALLRIHYYVT